MGEYEAQPADWPGAPPYLFGTPYVGDQFANEYPRAAALIPTIYACISKLAKDLAGLPIVWEQRAKGGEWEPLDDGHWIPALFADGNPQYSGHEVIRDLVAGLKMSGTSLLFADTRKGAEKVPRELWHVPYHMAKAVPGPFRSVRGYMWWPNVQFIDSTDIVPFREWNPNWNPIYPGPEGLSPLSAARMAFETRGRQGRWQRGLFGRGAQVAGMFTSDGADYGMKESDAKKVQARLSRMGGDVEDFIKPVIVSGLKQVRPPILPKDLLFLEMMGAADKDIFMIYGIPPAIMGVKESGSLSTAGMDSDMLLYDSGPLTWDSDLIARIITDQFCRRWAPGVRCRFDLSGRIGIAGSMLKQIEGLTKGAGRPVLTLNQARRMSGEPEADDPNADVFMVPFNMIRSEDMADDIRVQPGAPGQAPDVADNTPAAKPPSKNSRLVLARRSAARMQSLRKWRNADLARYERQVSRWATARFTRQEERVVARIKASSGKLARRVKLADDYELEGPDDWQEAQRLFANIISDRGEAAAAEIGKVLNEAAMNVHRGRLHDLIARRSHDVIQNLDATTSKMLRQTLDESVAAGESIDQLVSRVSAVFFDRRDNAETIARTETAWAYNTASIEAWKESDVRFKSWLTAEDGAVRETHSECEAQGIIGMEEAFSNGLLYPGDPDGDASEVCNCRCTLMPEFNAEGGDVPSDAGEGGDVAARLRARMNGAANGWPAGFFKTNGNGVAK
jgi:SPP1 gp7 family putative phage head morphogenesis protein